MKMDIQVKLCNGLLAVVSRSAYCYCLQDLHNAFYWSNPYAVVLNWCFKCASYYYLSVFIALIVDILIGAYQSDTVVLLR